MPLESLLISLKFYYTATRDESGGDALRDAFSFLSAHFSSALDGTESLCSESLTTSNKEGWSQQICFQFRIIIHNALYYIKNDKIETPDGRRVPEFSVLKAPLLAFAINFYQHLNEAFSQSNIKIYIQVYDFCKRIFRFSEILGKSTRH
jgi:hypothetical protein